MDQDTSELRMRLAPWNRFKPSSKTFYWPFQGGTSFVDLLCFFCLVFVMPLCASVYLCLVVSCLKKGWPLGSHLWCITMHLSTFPLVSWVRLGTWLYRFLIFALFLTLMKISWLWGSKPFIILNSTKHTISKEWCFFWSCTLFKSHHLLAILTCVSIFSLLASLCPVLLVALVGHSGKSTTIREYNYGLDVCKEHYE